MFVNTIQSLSSLLLWIWADVLPQPIGALFSFAILALLLFGAFKLLWELI